MQDEYLTASEMYDQDLFSEAFVKFLTLAEAGNVDAMTRVACMYGDGLGTSLDIERSIAWDMKAVEFGSQTSMFNLGITYRNKGDAIEARRWFERLRTSGDGDAALELAKMYMVSDLETERVRLYLTEARDGLHSSQEAREEAQQLLNELNGR